MRTSLADQAMESKRQSPGGVRGTTACSHVCHVVISLSPGGLEKLVVELTNERNHRYAGSTVICCLDELGALATQVEGGAVMCVEADRSRFPFDVAAVRKLRKRVLSVECRVSSEREGKEREVTSGKCEDSATQQLSNLATQQPATVLHAHNMAAWQYGALATMGTGARLVYTQHGANVHNRGFRNRLRSALWACFTDQIVAVSESTAKAMAETQGLAREKIVVIPNGVSAGKKVSSVECRVSNAEPGTKNSTTLRSSSGQAQQPNNRTAAASALRVKLGIPAAAFVVGSVGRFSPEKNYPLLVRAFAEFRMECPNSFLVLVGDGDQRLRIEETARELGVGGRCLLPGLQKDVEPWLEAMDVFCLSSVTEGMPVSLLEAGACGLPAVVTDVGGTREVVQDGVTGWVVSAGNAQGITSALKTLQSDGNLRRGMGTAAARRMAQAFSIGATVEAYERAYDT